MTNLWGNVLFNSWIFLWIPWSIRFNLPEINEIFVKGYFVFFFISSNLFYTSLNEKHIICTNFWSLRLQCKIPMVNVLLTVQVQFHSERCIFGKLLFLEYICCVVFDWNKNLTLSKSNSIFLFFTKLIIMHIIKDYFLFDITNFETSSHHTKQRYLFTSSQDPN